MWQLPSDNSKVVEMSVFDQSVVTSQTRASVICKICSIIRCLELCDAMYCGRRALLFVRNLLTPSSVRMRERAGTFEPLVHPWAVDSLFMPLFGLLCFCHIHYHYSCRHSLHHYSSQIVDFWHIVCGVVELLRYLGLRTGLRIGRQRSFCSILGKDKWLISTQEHRGELWGPPSLLFSAYQGHILLG